MVMRLKVGDSVIMRSGFEKGKTGKITKVLPKQNKVLIEGINVRKRHQKPTQALPQGGVFEEAQPVDISKVGLVHPTKKDRATRVSYKVNARGNKVRIATASGKEIK